MAGNHNDRRKAKNGRYSSAERKAAKNNGRGKSQKANGGSGRSAGSLIAIGGAEDREDTKIILSYIANMIIDQHFSERGRIRRLLGAVAQNPRMLGIGIDEDTAVVIEGDGTFHALGSGAVYVVDGHDLSYTN
jgi:hypothetical protein